MEKGTHRESGQYWTKSCMGWAVRDYDSQTKTWTGKAIIGSLSDAVFDEIDENPITYETRIPTPDEKSVIENAVKDYAYSRMMDFEDFDGSEEEFIENYIAHNIKQ